MKFRIITILTLICLFSSAIYAQNQDKLKPFLTDINGWKAEQAEGMSMDMGTMKITNATREYNKGNATFSALIMVGTNAMTQGQFGSMTMNMDTDDIKVVVTKMQGFKTTHSYDKKEKSGSFTVFMGQKGDNGGFFGITYEGISMQEAEKIAKKFDWKNIKKAVKKLL